jgi:tetratricopeptide (TPR) repeat protein
VPSSVTVQGLDLAEARLKAGALNESLSSFEDAYGMVRDPTDRAAILGRISWVHQSRSDPRQASKALERAFAALGERVPDDRLRSVPGHVGAWVKVSMRRRIGAARDTRLADVRCRRRQEILCDLLYQCARLSVEQGQPLRVFQSTLRLMTAASGLGPSAALAKGYAAYGCAMVTMGNTVAGFNSLARALRVADKIGDPALYAYCLQLEGVARYWIGSVEEANELVRRCLDEYGAWLEVNEFCVNSYSPRSVEGLRGRPRCELAWIERAIDRAMLAGQAPAAFSVVEEGAKAALVALGREREIPDLMERVERLPRSDTGQGFLALMRWPLRIRACTEPGELGTRFESLVDEFAAEGHDPRRAHPVLCEYYVHVAHARAHQCLRAPRGQRSRHRAALQCALEDLRAMARAPLAKAHVHAVDGYHWFLRGDPGRARRHLRKARSLAEQEACPWVLYAVARAEAHLLRGWVTRGSAQAKARSRGHAGRGARHGTSDTVHPGGVRPSAIRIPA